MPANRIVLFNPPASRIIIRDNFCSKVSQASYINHPIDFIMQSGFLGQIFDVKLIDSIVDRLNEKQSLAKLRSLDPLGIFALAGNASWHQDVTTFARLKAEIPDVKLILSGDLFLEEPVSWLKKFSFIDGILLDYTTADLTHYFKQDFANITQMAYRRGDELIEAKATRQKGAKFIIPIPNHEMFTCKKYSYPFVKKLPFATVMTEFGCPFSCAFCVMGTLGHKIRPLSNVFEELDAIRAMGIQDVFFLDQTFGSSRVRNREFCSEMQSRFSNLRWLCFSRVDLMDEEVLNWMKDAGCHTIILGVESASQQLLDQYRKNYSVQEIIRTFSLMKKLKIRSVATFLLGLPGETWESACRTIEFAKELDCDFASLNIAVPRMGTDMRKWAIEKGYVSPDLTQFDQSGAGIIMKTENLSKEQLEKLKRKAIFELYLRPKNILRRLLSIQSISEFRIQLADGLQLIRNFLFKN